MTARICRYIFGVGCTYLSRVVRRRRSPVWHSWLQVPKCLVLPGPEQPNSSPCIQPSVVIDHHLAESLIMMTDEDHATTSQNESSTGDLSGTTLNFSAN